MATLEKPKQKKNKHPKKIHTDSLHDETESVSTSSESNYTIKLRSDRNKCDWIQINAESSETIQTDLSETITGSLTTQTESDSYESNISGTKCIKIGSKVIEIGLESLSVTSDMQKESESSFYDDSLKSVSVMNSSISGSACGRDLKRMSQNESIGNSVLLHVENYDDTSFGKESAVKESVVEIAKSETSTCEESETNDILHDVYLKSKTSIRPENEDSEIFKNVEHPERLLRCPGCDPMSETSIRPKCKNLQIVECPQGETSTRPKCKNLQIIECPREETSTRPKCKNLQIVECSQGETSSLPKCKNWQIIECSMGETSLKSGKSENLQIVECHPKSENVQIVKHAMSETSTCPKSKKNESIGTISSKQYEYLVERCDIKQLVVKKNIVEDKATSYPELPIIDSLLIPTAPHESMIEIEPLTEVQLSALYNNQELEAVREFGRCFAESELRRGTGGGRAHRLRQLLSDYAHARAQLRDISRQLHEAVERSRALGDSDGSWQVDSGTICSNAKCACDVQLTANIRFPVAKLRPGAVQQLETSLTTVRQLLNEQVVSCAHRCDMLRSAIERYIFHVTCSAGIAVPSTKPELKEHSRSEMRELRACISELFWQQRSGAAARDPELVNETRRWLNAAVSALLHAADWQDHAYILNHILCCPGGVSTWAASFLQVPIPVKPDRLLDHALAMLAILLTPPHRRDEFLSHSGDQSGCWVVIDSDGEDEIGNNGSAPLKENDLVALLNQIPLSDVFRSAMPVVNRPITEHNLLRFYAFCTTLLQLLEEGLCTYGSVRYNQFAKRLGRLASHTLQYAADILETVLDNGNVLNINVTVRLQLELDELILRGVKCLFSAGRQGALGVWQFLAVLPFRSASGRQLWRLYVAIHGVDLDDTLRSSEYWRRILEDPETSGQFEELLVLLGVDSSYYLLSALANTASARANAEPDLAIFAIAEFLNIGFVRETTRDSCSKACAALIGLIITRNTQLTSDLIKEVNMCAGELDEDGSLLRLFGELPLGVWKPDESDWKMLQGWLTLCVPSDWRHRLARLVISELDWFRLTNEEHDCIAWIVISCVEHLESWAGLPPRDDERAPTSDRAAAIWAWRVIFSLRLHATHRDGDVSKSPELKQFPVIESGVRQRIPFAMYLALLMTSTGQLIPMVCSHGFSILNSLIELGAIRAAISALNAILPLFVECSDSLAACSGFRTALSSLLVLDKPSYVRSAARSIVGAKPVGPIAKELGLLLRLHLATPRLRPLASAWLRALIAQPNWQRDTGIMSLLDLIAQLSFGDKNTYSSLAEVLSTRLDEQSGGQSSGLLGWVSGNSSQANTIFGGTASQPQWPWLANLCLEVEFEKLEKRTDLWQELLILLYESTGKTNIDSSLKKASATVKCAWVGGSSALCVYRWASQALETPLEHPLLPVLWQKFFELYLERVPCRLYEQHLDRGCVGGKFFEGVVNAAFCKKLKKRLKETVAYYESNGKENLTKLFNTFTLWLEEPLLKEPALYLPSIPPQYDPTHLGRILRGDKDPWLEYLNSDVLRYEHERAVSEWNDLFRWPLKTRSILTSTSSITELPRNRLIRRLSSYDKPQPLTTVALNQRPSDGVSIYGDEPSALQVISIQISKLRKLSELHRLQLDAHLALDQQWLETIPLLWQPVKMCKVIEKTCGVTCKGSAKIQLQYNEWKRNKVGAAQTDNCRTVLQTLVDRALKPGEGPAARPCSILDAAIEDLSSVAETGEITPKMLHIATEMYYVLIASYNTWLNKFPASRDTLKYCTDSLGSKFIIGAEEQQSKVCHILLKHPTVAPLILQHFHPVSVSSEVLLQMYSDIVNGIGNTPDVGLILLSRIKVADWLNGRKPRLAERSRLISMIFTLLTKPNMVTQLQEKVRTHLLDVFRHEFPEHYGEVIQLALTNSSMNTLPPVVWLDLVKTIWGTKGTPRELAARQRLLQYEVLRESATTLGRYFSTERLKHCSTYGLYVRYRPYITQISQLLHLLSLSFINAATETYRGALADTIVQLVWPPLLEVFAPWLLPNWPPDNQTRTSPWTNTDTQLARHLLTGFTDSIGFILDTLPGNRTVLSYVWQLYAGSFAIPSIDVHVIRSVNASLITLPWSRFWPSLRDVELMATMADQYLPENHEFLAKVFQSIDWNNWLTGLSPGSMDMLPRALSSLLQLLVKLSGEGEINDAIRLLTTGLEWPWEFIEPPVLSHVIDWWVMSVDPQIVLQLHTDTIEELNQAVIKLIETAATYAETPKLNKDPNSILKRQCLVRAYAKLLIGCSSRYKTLLQKQAKLVQNAITYHLQRIDNLLSVTRHEQSVDPLMCEILTLINNTNLNDSVITAIETWLTSHQSDNFAVGAVMRMTCISVTEGESCGRLLEVALEVFFGRSSTTPRKDGWELAVISVRWGGGIALEKILGVNGQLLTLHCLLMKRVPSIEQALEWISEAKPVNEMTEPKLVLIWKDVLEAALRLVNSGEGQRAVAGLRKFTRQLCVLADESGGWGRAVLGALMGSKRGVSNRTRLFARAVAGFILAQIPESRDDSSDVLRVEPNASCAVGQPGGNTECPKLLLKLDGGAELRSVTETALRRIQDPSATIHDSIRFLYDIAGLLYSEPYLIKND